MAKTLAQIKKQIEALQREAEALRQKETAGVVARIREAIEHYGLTPQELFGDAKAPAGRRGRQAAAKKRATGRAGAKKTASPPKYRDEAGHTWTGRGKRPGWFKDALAAGKTAADLEIKG